MPEVSGQLDQGNQVVAGHDRRRVVSYFVASLELYPLTIKGQGQVFQCSEQRLLGLDGKGRAWQVIYGLLGTGKSLQRMKSANLSARVLGWRQNVSRSSAAAMDHPLAWMPSYLSHHRGDGIIGSGDEHQLGRVSRSLIILEATATGNCLCQPLSRTLASAGDGHHRVAPDVQSDSQGGAHRSSSNESQFEHLASSSGLRSKEKTSRNRNARLAGSSDDVRQVSRRLGRIAIQATLCRRKSLAGCLPQVTRSPILSHRTDTVKRSDCEHGKTPRR